MSRKLVLDRNEFHAPEKLGKTRSLTPEGFLLCSGVAIARTGEQKYAAQELLDSSTGKPVVEAGPDGVIIIGREPQEVFRDETIASFEGKPVTVEHPNEFVSPENWKKHSVGTVQNVQKGTGVDEGFLMADLLITDKGAIEHVNRDLPELSAGYDAEYTQTEVGHGVQRNILGNHVALVDRGRAGPRCSIRDSMHEDLIKPPEEKTMAKVKVIDRLLGLLTAVKSKDQAALDRILVEDDLADGDGAAGAMDARMKKVEDWMDAFDKRMSDAAEEKKKDDEKEEGKTKEAEDTILSAEELKKNPDMLGRTWVGDSAAPVIKDILSRAEILVPGISIPSTDSVSHAGIKNLMLSTLSSVAATADGKALLEPFLYGRSIQSMDAKSLFGVFNGAAEAKRLGNNAAHKVAGLKTTDFGRQPTTIEDINKANREFWATGGKR